jgi:hypothetical protein
MVWKGRLALVALIVALLPWIGPHIVDGLHCAQQRADHGRECGPWDEDD